MLKVIFFLFTGGLYLFVFLKKNDYENMDVNPLIEENLPLISESYSDLQIKKRDKKGLHSFTFAPFQIGGLFFGKNVLHERAVQFVNTERKKKKFIAKVKINIFTENYTVAFTEV